MIGGYKILDLLGKSFNSETPTSYTYKGIYEDVESTTKPIVIEGLVIDDIEQKPIFANMYVQGVLMDNPSFDCIFYSKNGLKFKIQITDDDKVTLYQLVD